MKRIAAALLTGSVIASQARATDLLSVPDGYGARETMFSQGDVERYVEAYVESHPVGYRELRRDYDAPHRQHEMFDAALKLAFYTALDVESTFYMKEKLADFVEHNPLMRPFVDSGRQQTYAFAFMSNLYHLAAVNILREKGFEKWQALPEVFSALHAFFAARNLSKIR